MPDGTEETYEVPVEKGKYNHEIDVDTVGDWSVETFWAGDAGHLDAQSGSVVFSVVEASEPVNDDVGIPGFPAASILLGALFVIVLHKKVSTRHKYVGDFSRVDL
jgi:hypothetical protein